MHASATSTFVLALDGSIPTRIARSSHDGSLFFAVYSDGQEVVHRQKRWQYKGDDALPHKAEGFP